MHEEISPEMVKELENNYLFPPGLWISAPLSNGWDPDDSLACKIYKTIEDAKQEKT